MDLQQAEAFYSTVYLANKFPGVVIALNSKEFPLGSLKNIVHCSPGCPEDNRNIMELDDGRIKQSMQVQKLLPTKRRCG